jgi:hypothetical protein
MEFQKIPPPSQRQPESSTGGKILKGVLITLAVLVLLLILGVGLLYAACGGLLR